MSTNLSYDVACIAGRIMIVVLEKQFLPAKPLCKANNKATWDLPSIPPSALQPKQRQQKHQWNDSTQTHRHKLAIS